MRNRSLAFCLVLIGVVLVAGCEPTVRGTACALDEECQANQACIDHECQQVQCRDDSNCGLDERCVDYLCEPLGACGSDGQCPAGEICEAGACIPGCRTDGDCPTGQICETQTCRVGCRENGDCPDGRCDPDTLTCAGQACADDADCVPGQVCLGQICSPGCNGDEDCPAGQVCDPAALPDGACGDCLTDADCQEPDAPVCVEGACASQCEQDGDCPAGQVCVGHRCEVPDPVCDLQIEPSQAIDFGSLPEGGLGLATFSLTNAGPGACNISELYLREAAIGGQANFLLIDPPDLPAELQPAGQAGDRLEIQVAYAPATSGQHAATFWLASDDPDLAVGSDEQVCQVGGPWIAGQACVPLNGSAEPSCDNLVALPQGVDFGFAAVGCLSSRRQVQIYNLANGPRTIEQLALEPAQPAFEISSAPALPAVIPSGGHLDVEIRFSPQAVGLEAATLRLVPAQAACEVGVPLFGIGVDSSSAFDSFTLPAQALVDVLWVVDNSSSMAAVQTSLAQHFREFLLWALQVGVDFHVGVVTTDMEDRTQAGRLQGDPLIITPMTVEPEEAFAANVQVGTDGSPIEMGLAAALAALTDPLASGHNAGFSRADARLAVIWVSDEDDGSPWGVDLYFDFFLALKGSLDKLALSAVCGDWPDGCVSGDGTSATGGRRYLELVDMSDGMFQSICSPDWNSLMQQLGLFAFAPQRTFRLGRTAVAGTVEVWVDGGVVPEAPVAYGVNGWTLVPGGAAIWFGDNVLPAFGSTVDVAYQAACQ